MLRRVRFLLLLLIPVLLIPLLPTATAQPDGESSCAAALAAANSGAKTWNGYKIVRSPKQGSTGSDLLCGFAGDDTLWGGTGDDILVGGPGADALYGETGDDTLYAEAQDRVVNGGTGRNQIIQALPTPTPITPTATPVTPTATPTETPITPTETPVTPTETPITPTPTPVTPTATPDPVGSCWWMSSDGTQWYPAIEVVYYAPSYAECRQLDGCFPGGLSAHSSCYKWTIEDDDTFAGWT